MKGRLTLAAAALVALSACQMKGDVAMDVRRDGSGTITMAFGADDELMRTAKGMGQDPFTEASAQFPAGWKVTRWTSDGFTGVRGTHAFATPAELESIVQRLGRTGGPFETFHLTREGKDFVFNAKPSVMSSFDQSLTGVPTGAPAMPVPGGGDSFGIGSSLNGLAGASKSMLEAGRQAGESADQFGRALSDAAARQAADFLKLTVSLDLPGKVTAHNASRVVAGRLVWDVKPGHALRMTARSHVSDPVMPAVPLAIGVLAVVAAGGAVMFSRSTLGA